MSSPFFRATDCEHQFTVGSDLSFLPLSVLSGLGRLTPPTMPIAFPLHVPSVTFTPNFTSLSIAADNFFDDSPSLFAMTRGVLIQCGR